MTTPTIQALWNAYTNKLYLSRADIAEIFGCSGSTASRLMKQAKEAQKGLPQFNGHSVRAKEALEGWGIDLGELKKRIKETKNDSRRKKTTRLSNGIGEQRDQTDTSERKAVFGGSPEDRGIPEDMAGRIHPERDREQ